MTGGLIYDPANVTLPTMLINTALVNAGVRRVGAGLLPVLYFIGTGKDGQRKAISVIKTK